MSTESQPLLTVKDAAAWRAWLDADEHTSDRVWLVLAKKGTVEEWVIRNKTPMYHPIHLHSWPFQAQGQEGWQDVVQVAPYTEQVIRVSYDDFGGTTVLHCHILDHEDTGMMAIIRVQ